jgi:hypothetical protein
MKDCAANGITARHTLEGEYGTGDASSGRSAYIDGLVIALNSGLLTAATVHVFAWCRRGAGEHVEARTSLVWRSAWRQRSALVQVVLQVIKYQHEVKAGSEFKKDKLKR